MWVIYGGGNERDLINLIFIVALWHTLISWVQLVHRFMIPLVFWSFKLQWTGCQVLCECYLNSKRMLPIEAKILGCYDIVEIWTIIWVLLEYRISARNACQTQSNTATVLCAIFQNDWTGEPDFMNKGDFARFDLGWVSDGYAILHSPLNYNRVFAPLFGTT